MFTQMPNWYIDDVMPKVSSGATIVFMVICRQTIGWQKDSDTISLSQFMNATGLTKPTVIKAIRELVAVGILHVVESPSGHTYTIVAPTSKESLPPTTSKESLPSQISLPEVVKDFDQPVVKNIDPQKKGLNKRKKDSTRDARIDSWQLQVYRELVHLQVPHALRDTVLSVVDDQSRWRIVITEWIGRGYRPNAITGMLDWYTKGIPNYAQRRTSRQDNGRSRNNEGISAEEWVRRQTESI